MARTVSVDFGDRKIRFHPLNVDLLEAHAEDLKELLGEKTIADMLGPKFLPALARVATASAQLADPSVRESDIRRELTVANAGEVLAAILGSSGFRQAANGASAVPTSPRTGGASELGSSPQE